MPASTFFYKRSNFVTHLPAERLYSPSHFWLAQEEANRWRIGLTKFATRMLGEIVDHAWEKESGASVQSGEIIGSIEGFKAISDVYCVANGIFLRGNPALTQHIELVGKDPYGAGWLYMVEGTPDPKCGSLERYCQLLDATIDRMLAKQKSGETE